MGKRSSFERRERDYYPTPIEAVKPLLPFLKAETSFIEPCCGDGALIAHLKAYGHDCTYALDIAPRMPQAIRQNARAFKYVCDSSDHYEFPIRRPLIQLHHHVPLRSGSASLEHRRPMVERRILDGGTLHHALRHLRIPEAMTHCSNLQMALDLFETNRKEWLIQARRIAKQIASTGQLVNVNIVREHCPAPKEWDGRVFGAVFRGKEWERVHEATVRSKRSECHHREIAQFRLVAE